jgi:flagellar biosynthesis anti-sigma factor FlgM
VVVGIFEKRALQMRIPDGYSRRIVPVSKARSRGAAAAVAATAGVSIHGADNVEVSARAAEVAYARTVALKAPEVRAPLVEELSELIGQGQYLVSGGDVAPALIQEHLQLASARRGLTN